MRTWTQDGKRKRDKQQAGLQEAVESLAGCHQGSWGQVENNWIIYFLWTSEWRCQICTNFFNSTLKFVGGQINIHFVKFRHYYRTLGWGWLLQTFQNSLTLQWSLFYLECRPDAVKTPNLNNKGSNTNPVRSFKHGITKPISRFPLTLKRLLIFSCWWCSKGQGVWDWLPRKTNSNPLQSSCKINSGKLFLVSGVDPNFFGETPPGENSSFLIVGLCQEKSQEGLKGR